MKTAYLRAQKFCKITVYNQNAKSRHFYIDFIGVFFSQLDKIYWIKLSEIYLLYTAGMQQKSFLIDFWKWKKNWGILRNKSILYLCQIVESSWRVYIAMFKLFKLKKFPAEIQS